MLQIAEKTVASQRLTESSVPAMCRLYRPQSVEAPVLVLALGGGATECSRTRYKASHHAHGRFCCGCLPLLRFAQPDVATPIKHEKRRAVVDLQCRTPHAAQASGQERERPKRGKPAGQGACTHTPCKQAGCRGTSWL